MALAGAGCAGGGEGRRGAELGSPSAETGAETGAAAAARDLEPGAPALDEAAARQLLAERFRAAGLRVRYDVLVARAGAYELTVDGYDPERRTGYEYVAERERERDLEAGERAQLARAAEVRILVIDAASATEIAARADAFLAALADAESARP